MHILDKDRRAFRRAIARVYDIDRHIERYAAGGRRWAEGDPIKLEIGYLRDRCVSGRDRRVGGSRYGWRLIVALALRQHVTRGDLAAAQVGPDLVSFIVEGCYDQRNANRITGSRTKRGYKTGTGSVYDARCLMHVLDKDVRRVGRTIPGISDIHNYVERRTAGWRGGVEGNAVEQEVRRNRHWRRRRCDW